MDESKEIQMALKIEMSHVKYFLKIKLLFDFGPSNFCNFMLKKSLE